MGNELAPWINFRATARKTTNLQREAWVTSLRHIGDTGGNVTLCYLAERGMGNELAPFTETAVQTVFNWDETFAETKELVKEDAELTATIDDAMVKRFHGRVKIGQNLLALQANHSKHRHGDFTTTVLPDLDIDKKFAYRCIGAANLVTQLENSIVPSLGQLNILDLPMPMDTWNRLASPSGQTVVKQLESGEIKPTQEDIKKALEEERARLAEERQRNEELKEFNKELQGRFDLFRERSEQELDAAQINALQGKGTSR